MGHFQKRKYQGVQRKWVVTTVEVRGTLPGNAREGAPTTGVELAATTGEGTAGEG